MGRRNDNNIKCTIICCSRYLSCSRIQRRTTDSRPALVVDQAVRPGCHCRALCRIGPIETLTVPAADHFPGTTSATGDVTVPEITWWARLIRCAATQADNKKDRNKEPHLCINRRSGTLGFCTDPGPTANSAKGRFGSSSNPFLTWRFANRHDSQWLLLVLHTKHPFDPAIHEGPHYYRTQTQGLGL